MPTQPSILLASLFAYVSAVALVLGFVFLIVFFMAGQPFGSLNDFFGGMLLPLTMVPLALVLHQLYGNQSPLLSWIALIAGLVGMALQFTSGGLVILKSVGAASFAEPSPGTGPYGMGMIGPAVVGVWLLLIGVLTLTTGRLPNGLAWASIVAGAGYVLGLVGFAVGGAQHPLAGGGWIAAAIGYLVWAIWLGRVLASPLA